MMEDTEKFLELIKDNPPQIYSLTDKYENAFIITVYRRLEKGNYESYQEYIIRDDPFQNNNNMSLFNAITKHEYKNKYIENPYETIKPYCAKDSMRIKFKQHRTLKKAIENDNDDIPLLKDIAIDIREIQEEKEADYYRD